VKTPLFFQSPGSVWRCYCVYIGMHTTSTHATAPLPDCAPEQLPDEPALLKAMLRELLELLRTSRQDNESLRHRLDQLLRRLYGPRAERWDPAQLLLFPDLLTPPEAPSAVPATLEATAAAPEPEQSPSRPSKGHGRGALPSHLPRTRRVHELSSAERACPCCGVERQVIGQEVTEQLDYVPASLQVIEHVRLTYACRGCVQAAQTVRPAREDLRVNLPVEATVAAPTDALNPAPEPTQALPVARPLICTAERPGQPVPKGLPGPGLLAHVIVSKYGDHLPLYRLEHIFARSGVPLSRSTLCGWLPVCAQLLTPLYQCLVERVLDSWVVQTDDTSVPVQEPGKGRTRTGRLWVAYGDAYHPYVVYDYTPTREQVGPQTFFARYLGYLQADGYTGYDALYATGRLVEVGCWAHARRKFYEARTTDPGRSAWVLGVIKQLYAVEQQAQEEGESRKLALPERWWLRLRLRQEQSVPLLTRLYQWFEGQQAEVLPKSPFGEALTYARNQWQALLRYATQGYLEIDNNRAEGALRAIAVGRKNYLFFGSDAGGETAAVLYSLVQTCKRLGVEPWHYLRDVLEQLPNTPAAAVEDWLPDRWAARQRQASLAGE
jgi:transposase